MHPRCRRVPRPLSPARLIRGFSKVRHYGLFSPSRHNLLAQAREQLIAASASPRPVEDPIDPASGPAPGIGPRPRCPACGVGGLHIVETLRPCVARYDPEARGARAEKQRHTAAHAEAVVGPRGALKLFGPASLGVAGFVTPDQLFRLPDFRAGERAFAQLWAAAERVRADGAVVIQSQNPEHYALGALAGQDLGTFYREELKFRAELGYPPFRRLAIVTITGKSATDIEPTVEAVGAALRGAPQLTIYPPAADRRERARRIVVKAGDDLAALLESALGDFRRARGKQRGVIDVEVDPVEWPL